MFGRVRAPSYTLDGPPSKTFKDDPLSVYEATLIKLKQGSQCGIRPPSDSEETVEEMESDCSTATVSTSCIDLPTVSSKNISQGSQHVITAPGDEAMLIDTGATSANTQSSPGTSQLTSDSKQQQSRNMPLVYMFSKYNSSRRALSSPETESMSDISYHGSATTSAGSSNFQSFGHTKEQFEHECHSSTSDRLI